MNTPIATMKFDNTNVEVYPNITSLGEAAAWQAASIIGDAIRRKGRARIIVGTGNSQESLVVSLARTNEFDWQHVEIFHMDEYVGMNASHPASFRFWLRSKLVNSVNPGKVHYLQGDADNLQAECDRYGRLLREQSIDLSFVGFGENGHIAFNDPHVADLYDPLPVKIVDLDKKCRKQQVGEGHFPNLEEVPTHALTVTCPVLLTASYLICSVPEKRKAQAVQNALKGPITSFCPASFVRTHPRSHVYLDVESCQLL